MAAPHLVEWLDAGSGHRIYVEESGSPRGVPVVFLHGGPGRGCSESHRQLFDPERYRVILFDQRGAGRSLPAGRTVANSTPELIADMERIRRRFGVDRWVVVGGSWGASLALAYAETHPDRVLGMVLRSAFLARARDVAWFSGDGAGRFLPAAWDTFVASSGCDPRAALVGQVHAVIFGDDRAAAEHMARAWARWSGEVVTFSIDRPEPELPESLAQVLAQTRIEMHFAIHRYFLRENQLLDDAPRLPRVPVTIVHGQRDLTCPPEAAWDLHRAIPGSALNIVRTAGHLSADVPLADALLEASDRMVESVTVRRRVDA